MGDSIVSEIKEQGKGILAMMAVAIISVLAMIVLDYFTIVIHGMTALGNATIGNLNSTITITLTLFITSFGIVGSFAAITMLIIVIKVIIGVVKGLKS